MKDKSITILGKKFFYNNWDYVDEYGFQYSGTEFFISTKLKYEKKGFLGLFGPIIEIEVPNVLFSVTFDIENPRWTKTELRAKLEKEVELLNRKDEIKKGELI